LRFFAEPPLRERTRNDRLRPPRRQAPRSSPVESAFHRRRTQCRSLARCVARQCLRFLQPLRSTSTALDRLKPRRSAEASPCDDAVLQGFWPHRTIDAYELGDVLLLAESRQPSLLGTGPDRLAPHRCRPFTWPSRATLDVHYPAPFGSDTFFREIVDPPVGETDTSERLHAVAELTLDFQSIADLLSRMSAACRHAFARRLVKGLFYRVPPRRGP